MTQLRMPGPDGEEFDYISRGRYMDQWAFHNGSWLIVDRMYVRDLNTTWPVLKRDTTGNLPLNDLPLVPSLRNRDDPSYGRLFPSA